MNNIFIFTASNKQSETHLEASVDSPFVDAYYGDYLTSDILVKDIDSAGGCYCWGNTLKTAAHGSWTSIKNGDYLICYQNGFYTYFTRIIGKEHNKHFSEKIWGSYYHPVKGVEEWWEWMYFFNKPLKLPWVAWENLPEIRSLYTKKGLPQNMPYGGFTDISVGVNNKVRISDIINNYGSLDEYFKQKLSVKNPKAANKKQSLIQKDNMVKPIKRENLSIKTKFHKSSEKDNPFFERISNGLEKFMKSPFN